MSVAVISANLGNIDNNVSRNTDKDFIKADFFLLNENNYKIRKNAMHPRLQAKIPKMLGYELFPGYDYFIWLDGNFHLKEGAVENLVNDCIGYDACFFPHPHRQTVGEEFDFMEINTKGNTYLRERYENEHFTEQRMAYSLLSGYNEMKLYACGCFIYNKSLLEKQDPNILEQWFYHNCRYSVQDQLSLPYLMLKNKDIYNFGELSGSIVTYESIMYLSNL